MRELFLAVIRRGGYDLNTLLRRIDEYHIEDKLTDEERVELMAAARGAASPGMDVVQEIQKLWAAIRELREENADKSGEIEGGIDEADVPEFVQPTGAHDGYYHGDLVRYNEVLYMCNAPEGVVCVWSPEIMPDYWQVM